MRDETRVLLVRHGQSEWNAAGRWQGQADPPLSDLGRLQAREAGRAVGAVDAIWSSDLQRAAETAIIIGDQIGVGPVVVDDRLRERDAGEWTGLTRAQIEQRNPGFLADGNRPPGWEPDRDLLRRAGAALASIAGAAPGGDVLVVTHAGVVFAVERHLGAQHTRLANTEGRWVTLAGDELRLGDRVVLAEPDDVTVPGQM
jgi:broad specificity phosphatase PhoE